MPLSARIVSLQQRHAALEQRILEEGRRPRPDEAELTRLKREKLRIKEALLRLRASQRE